MAAVLAAGVSGCATVTRGSSTAFTVETTPSGAAVETSLGLKCDMTPCTFGKVKRESEFTVTVSKAGYKTGTYSVTHKTSGSGGAGMAGNVLVGGLIGGIIDGNNGSTQDLVPNPLRVTLEPLEAAPATAALTSTPVAPAAVPAASSSATPAAAPAAPPPAATPAPAAEPAKPG
jgi:hypothetical protein